MRTRRRELLFSSLDYLRSFGNWPRASYLLPAHKHVQPETWDIHRKDNLWIPPSRTSCQKCTYLLRTFIGSLPDLLPTKNIYLRSTICGSLPPGPPVKNGCTFDGQFLNPTLPDLFPKMHIPSKDICWIPPGPLAKQCIYLRRTICGSLPSGPVAKNAHTSKDNFWSPPGPLAKKHMYLRGTICGSLPDFLPNMDIPSKDNLWISPGPLAKNAHTFDGQLLVPSLPDFWPNMDVPSNHNFWIPPGFLAKNGYIYIYMYM